MLFAPWLNELLGCIHYLYGRVNVESCAVFAVGFVPLRCGASGSSFQCLRRARATKPTPPARSTNIMIVLNRLVGWK